MAVVAYIIILSAVGNKYHQHLEVIKKQRLRLKHKIIDNKAFNEVVNPKVKEITKLKKSSYILFSVIGLSHLTICFFTDLNFLSTVITLIIFTFILAGVYWFKGISVTGFLEESTWLRQYAVVTIKKNQCMDKYGI